MRALAFLTFALVGSAFGIQSPQSNPGIPTAKSKFYGAFGFEAFVKTRLELAQWKQGTPENLRNPLPESQRKQIVVRGEAFSPGIYFLPMESRAIDAILRVGGPTESGSLRAIRIRKANGNVSTIDLYPFLSHGDMRSDVSLSPNDEIEFLPVGTRVTLGEGFKVPGIFESLSGERVSQLMIYARGPAKIGEPQMLVIENKSLARQPISIPIDELGQSPLVDPVMLPGDAASLLPAPSAAIIPPVYGYAFFQDARKQADARRGLVEPFTSNQTKPANPQPLPSTDRYQLGPGDSLRIRVTSTTEEPQEFDVRVDNSGNIVAPISGRVRTVRGQTLSQLQAALRQEIREYRRNASVEVNLLELRSMSITVMGEIHAPGSYEVPAVATLFQMLHMAGGPTERGSFRSIQLRRAGNVAHTFDLYEFLLFGDPRQDRVLQPGDVIFVPASGPRVRLEGEFLRPGLYELAEKERFSSTLKLGGGLKPSAVAQRVSIESVRPGVAKVLVDVNASSQLPENNPTLYDGDIVKAMSVRPELANVISVEGAVDQPGNYAFKAGMRVSDLIDAARGALPEASMERADLFRRNQDLSTTLIPIRLGDLRGQSNFELQPFDRLVIYSAKDLAWAQSYRVEVLGAVRNPGSYTRSQGMRVQDLLRMAGGTHGAASENGIFLQRYDGSGKPSTLLRLQLSRVASGDTEQNVLLEDRDVISVYTVEQASYHVQAVVEIRGAVQRPGFYPRAQGLTLDDLLALAGGLLPDASSSVEIAGAYQPSTTASTKLTLGSSASRQFLLKDGDTITVPSDASKRSRVRTVMIMGAIARPGPYTITDGEQNLSGLIQRAGGLTKQAFPEGAQFFRKPELLVSSSQMTLAPRIIQALAIVNDAEYRRAVAQADLLKLQAIRNVTSSGSITAIPGLGLPASQPELSIQGDVVKAVLDRETVTKARPLTESDFVPAGNINVQVDKALSRPNSIDDVILMDGDIILVPERPTSVSVAGALVLPSAVVFTPGQNVQFYVDRSGGPTLDAAIDQILVIKANGLVIKANMKTKVELGDMIFMPTKVMALRLGEQQSNLEKAGRVLSNGAIVYALIRSILR